MLPQSKQCEEKRLVAIVMPHQEASEMLNALSEKQSQLAVISSTSGAIDSAPRDATRSASGTESWQMQVLRQFCGQAKRRPTCLRTKKSITIQWDREWHSANEGSLRPHFVEGTTDLRARHRKEQELSKRPLHQRTPRASGHSHSHKRRQIPNRSHSEMCLSESRKKALRQSFMNTVVTARRAKSPVADCCNDLPGLPISQGCESGQEVDMADKPANLANCSTEVTADGQQESNSVVASQSSSILFQLPNDSPTEVVQGKGQLNAVALGDDSLPCQSPECPCPMHIVKSKSADELLNSRRGLRAKFALKYIGYRKLLQG